MSDKSHTPGPWKVTTCMDYWVEPADHPNDDGFYGIAHCGDIDWPDYQNKQDEWEANARLIAAAPDLLEALRYVRRFVKPADVDVAFIDAAIAKALGKEPV